MRSRYRLHSSAFERKDETEKIAPKRMVILSVEGDETERTYFQHLNTYLDETCIQIEILRHKGKGGYSDPVSVLELLEEYINLRDGELVSDDVLSGIAEKYESETIQAYLAGGEGLPDQVKNNIHTDLMNAGVDIEYRKYLQTFDDKNDFFAVVLDRDCGNHSRRQLEACVAHCEAKNYGCFITNPCFEFWLLLHLCDVSKTFSAEEQEAFLANEKASSKHTIVSLEVSKRAKHTKHISAKRFEDTYLPNIAQAIARAKEMATTFPELYDHLGSNLPFLFEKLEYRKSE